MPVIRVEYDNTVVTENDIRALCEVVKKIVTDVGFKEVFVYGNSSHIKVDIPPIEIWIEASEHKVTDGEALTKEIRNKLSAWKAETNFSHPINLTLIPMRWHLELEI